jgi:tetratricopeptide (TPR) repeat protein
LLKDIYGGENKKEVFLLTTALKARVIDHFTNSNSDNKMKSVDKMMEKLKQEFGFEDKSAFWASLSWAIGLGKVEEDEYIDIVNHISNSKEIDFLNYLDITAKKNSSMENKYAEIGYKFEELDWNAKGLALHNQGNYKEAIECYNKALSIDPSNESSILSNKGLSMHNQGNYKEAIECYNKALSIDPSNEFLKKRIGQTKEIIQRNNSKLYQDNGQISANKVQSHPKAKNPSRSIMHMAIFAIILTSIGSAAVIYLLILDKDTNIKPFTDNIESKANPKQASLANDISRDAIDSEPKDSKNQSISEFTNGIKNEIRNGEQSRANGGFSLNNSENLNNLPYALTQLSPESENEFSQTGQEQSNQFHIQNRQLDLFKTELARAMNTTFN